MAAKSSRFPSRAKKSKKKKKYVRESWTVDYPKPRKGKKNNQQFECFTNSVSSIWEGYDERKRDKENRLPFDKPEAFLKRQSFALLYQYQLGREDRRFIKRFVERFAPCRKIPPFGDNFFYWGLIAIYAVNGVAGKKEIDKAIRQISRYSNEMLYAQQNKIKADQLIGFINQSGCTRDIYSLVKGRIPDPSLQVKRL